MYGSRRTLRHALPAQTALVEIDICQVVHQRYGIERTCLDTLPAPYTASFTLGNENLELEVSVSDASIDSIRISNLNETVTAMYPLLQPSLDDLADQICKSQSLDNLTISTDSPYTSQLLVNAIRDALKKAAANN